MGNAGKAWMKSHPHNAMTKVASKALRAQAWDNAGQLPGPTQPAHPPPPHLQAAAANAAVQQDCTAANAANADAQAAAAANAQAVLQGMTASPVVPSGAQAYTFGEAATLGQNGSIFHHTQGRTFPPPPPLGGQGIRVPPLRMADGSALHIAPWHKPQQQQMQLQQGGLNQDIQLGMMLARLQARADAADAAQQEQGRQLELMQLSDNGAACTVHIHVHIQTHTHIHLHTVYARRRSQCFAPVPEEPVMAPMLGPPGAFINKLLKKHNYKTIQILSR